MFAFLAIVLFFVSPLTLASPACAQSAADFYLGKSTIPG